MNGITVDKNIMTIDIITILNLRTNNISDKTIINHISSFLQSINISSIKYSVKNNYRLCNKKLFKH